MQQPRPPSRPMMTLPQAVRLCLRRYAAFNGRATRAEFWWWALAANVLIIVAATVDATLSALLLLPGIGVFTPLALLIILGIFLPTLAVGVRRLHDIGKSGWWLLAWYCIDFIASLLLVVSLVGLLYFIALWAVDDDRYLGGALSGGFTLLVVLGMVGIAAILTILVVYAWAIVWLVKQGESGANKYGRDPREWNSE